MRQVIVLATRAVALVAIAGAGVIACESSDDGHTTHVEEEHVDYCTLPMSCRAIVDVCHDKDDGTNAEIHECHETAHDKGTDDACKAVQTDCIAKCNAAPELEGGLHEHFVCEGGAGMHDAGMHD
jgi:hypothetical protein